MTAPKASSPKLPRVGTHCIQRRGLLSAELAKQARPYLAVALVFLNKGRAGTENRWKR
jgi:hypothetical protein